MSSEFLDGRIALVTGASGGIGGAIAKALHGAGAKVALSGTRVEALYRDIRPLRIYEGTTEIQKLIIARTLLTR